METEIIYEDPEILLLDSLKEFEYLFKRVLIGINVHPSDIEMEKLVDIAKTISPNGDFSWKGCQSCIAYIITFIFNNQSRLITNAEEEE